MREKRSLAPEKNSEPSCEEVCHRYPYLRGVRKLLEADNNVVFAYVFGSHVSGLLRKESDLDLAVYFKEPPREVEELISCIRKLEKHCPREVDLKVLNGADPLLQRKAVNEGVLLVCKDRSSLVKFKESLMTEPYSTRMDKDLILRKIEQIRKYVAELKNKVHFRDFEKFQKDVVKKRFVERSLQLAIDSMLDICKHLASSLYNRVPDKYSECIDFLARDGYITFNRAKLYKNMVKYRNLIVYVYHKVDDAATYGMCKKHLDDFELFIEDILKVVEACGLKHKP